MADDPASSTNLVDMLCARAASDPDLRAYEWLDDQGLITDTLTFAELERKARAIAVEIRAHAGAGDRVLLLHPPGLDYIAAFYGCFFAGVVAVPAFAIDRTRARRGEARILAIADDAQPTLALTTRAVLETGGTGLERPGLRVVASDDLRIADPAQWQRPVGAPDGLALLQYTSGSTTTPRGVMLTHRNMLHNAAIQQRAWRLTPRSIGVSWLPLYHDLGVISCLIQPVYSGFPTTMLSPTTFMQRPLRWLRAISDRRGTFAGGPNFAFDLCTRKTTAEDRATLDLSSWDRAFNGAEPIRPETLEAFAKAFAVSGFRRTAMYPCYGLAEANFAAGGLDVSAEPVVRRFDRGALAEDRAVPLDAAAPTSDARTLVGCGTWQPGQDVRIVEPEALTECAPGRVGEIWLGGDSVASGYWRRAEESEALFHARLASGARGEYLRTGDLGFVSNGELFLTGRLKDLVIVRGLNHYPQDIERTIERVHPAMRAGCGAAFSIDVGGEERLVVVQEFEGDPAMAPDLFARMRQAVAEEHDLQLHAAALVRVGSIPKTTSGKIQRRASRDGFLSHTLHVIAEWAPPTASQPPIETTEAPRSERPSRAAIEAWLVARLARRLNVPLHEFDVRQPIARYGLDSREAVDLSSDLETWLGRAVPATIAYAFPTVEQLARHLAPDGVETTAGDRADVRAAGPEPIAIVGIGCRVPGASGPEDYWSLLRDGTDAITDVPASRWDGRALFNPDPSVPGKMSSRWGGFIEGVDQFDPLFFGISPREAAHLDPQQRFLLEVAWEALEDAGIPGSQLAGTRTGVFIGITTSDYGKMLWNRPREIDSYAATGTLNCIAANRISYALDLRGPSLSIDTACSASLVAIHEACQSLWSGESSLALAGGVNVILTPENTISQTKLGGMAADGRCKTFDARADGIVRGEGAGVVVLKKVSHALADGDRIYALVRGSAVNQDGRSNGLTAPNPEAQEAVLREAYRHAGVAPGDVQYVEAHGTGTRLGDPIEALALGAVLAEARQTGTFCAIGSAKTNFGHLESAAGVVGFIKVALALAHRALPPSLHFTTPNPEIPFDALPLRVQTALAPWPARAGGRLGGVSSFGMGGTNAHVVLSEAPERRGPVQAFPKATLFLLSARSSTALEARVRGTAAMLAATGDEPTLADLAFTAAIRQEHHDHRFAAVVSSRSELHAVLHAHGSGQAVRGVSVGVRPAGGRPRVVFVYSGHGSQHATMARGLLATEATFRDMLQRCDAALAPHLGWSVLEALTREAPELARVDVVQPCLFAIQVALTALWRAQGVVPDAVVGHSLGEVAAAYASGALSLDDAATVVALRSRLLRRLSGQGEMAVVGLGLVEARAAIARDRGRLSAAVSNSPTATVIAGEPAALARVLADLTAKNVFCRAIQADGAGHCYLIDPLRRELEAGLAQLRPTQGRTPFYSSVTGEPLDGGQLDAAYWGRNLRDPVLFSTSVQRLSSDGYTLFLEISPHPLLTTAVQQGLEHIGRTGMAVASLRRDEPDANAFCAALGTLHAAGCDVDLRAEFPVAGGRVVRLPRYPWQRQRYWLDAESDAGPVRKGAHPLLGRAMRVADAGQRWLGELDVSTTSPPFMRDHVLQGEALLNSLAYCEMALAAAAEALGPARYVVSEVVFRRALFVSAASSRTVQIAVTPDAIGGGRFEISSRAPGERDTPWTEHVTGHIARDDAHGGSLTAVQREHVRSRCRDCVERETFQAKLESEGVHFGPRFRGLERVWRRDGEALAEVTPPRELAAESDGYHFHPGLFDACGQALLATDSTAHAFMPVSIGAVRVYAPPTGRLWSHATTSASTEPGVLRGDVHVYDDDGNPIADLLGVRLQYLDEITARGVVESPKDWRYDLAWRMLEDPAPVRPRAEGPETWVVFADTTGLGDAVVGAIRSRGDHVVIVRAGSHPTGGISEALEARPSSVESVRTATAAALDGGKHGIAVRGVIYLWALDAPDNAHANEALAQDLGCTAAVAIVQELSSRSHPIPVWMVTRGGVTIASDDGVAVGAQAALWGAGRTLAIEHTAVWGKLVDVDPSMAHADAAVAVLHEIVRGGDENQIALRGNHRWAPRLVRKRPLEAAVDHPAATLRADATYVITGGLGGIGLVVARWLVDQGARRLLLLGRSTLPARSTWRLATKGSRLEEQVGHIIAMEALGASVHTAAVDVGDPEALGRCLDAFEQDGWPAIRGVVHAAAASNVRAAALLDAEAIAADFRPKVVGAWALDRWLGGRNVDFFVAFSSLTAILPSPFLAAYAAANAFVDALIADRRARGLAGTAIDWGMWADVGLSARLQAEQADGERTRGWAVGSLSPEQGLEAFGEALAHREPYVAIARMDWAAYAEAYPTVAESPVLRELTHTGASVPSTGANTLAAERDALRTLSGPERRARVAERLEVLARKVLRLGELRIEPSRSLDTLGLDSLMAAELRNGVVSTFGVAVPIVTFLRKPTLADLVGHIDAGLAALADTPGRSITPTSVVRSRDLPLSPAQEGLWYLDQLAPGGTVYFMTLAYPLEGDLDVAAMTSALTTLVARHEALRTVFPAVDGRAVQRILAPDTTVAIDREDLSSLAPDLRTRALSTWLERRAREPVDLARGPLMRIGLARVEERRHVFALGLHHIVTDGKSVAILAEEIGALYVAAKQGAPAKLAPPGLQLVDFVHWQQRFLEGAPHDELAAYWREALAGAPTRLALPTDRPRAEVQRGRGATVPLVLPADMLARTTDAARAEGATLYMALFAALAVVLGRHAAQDDFVIGTPAANRAASEFDRTVGFLINMLPLRARLGGDPTFRELLVRVRDTAHGAYAHQELPVAEIVRALGVPRETSHAPLFQVELALQPPLPSIHLAGCAVSLPEIVEDGTARFDLYFDLIERDGGISGSVEYDADLFDRETVERIVGEFGVLLTAATEAPDTRVSALPLLDAPARTLILDAWNATEVPYPDDVLIHRLIERQAARTPDATAVVFEGRAVRFDDLDARANRLARALIARGVGPDVLVGLLFERSIEMVVAILAVLKSGGAYVPIDPEYPRARVMFMLGDAAPPVLLTHTRQRDLLGEIGMPDTTIVLDVDADEAMWDALPSGPIDLPADHAHNLAYVIYTSGSTGNPKGAMNTHHGLANRLLWMQDAYKLDASDRVLQKTPYSFDVSVWEFLWPLMTGATLVVARPGGHRDPAYLRDAILRERITTLHFVPSMLQAFLMDDGVEQCTSLKRVLCSGEALPFELQELFFKRSHAELHNLYGPTEAAIDVTFWACTRLATHGRRVVPIGRPIANTRIYVLDAHGAPTPIGVAGELHIGGRNVGRGYLNRPDLTAASFVPDPFAATGGARMYKTGDLVRWMPDGAIEYLGRRDHQVKLRGVRIELGEIEEALGRVPTVRGCVVVVAEAPDGDRRLVAYWVGDDGASDVESLRNALRKTLPESMIPSAFIRIDAIPLSPNGKVDRAALPRWDVAQTTTVHHEAPRTDLEETLAREFATALGLPRVGIHDDFFTLGGHSLLAARLALGLARTLGREVPLGALVRAPTVSQLAALLSGELAPVPAPDLSADATLDPAIRPHTEATDPDLAGTGVFLTGATGFVGPFLLHELLSRTDATVWCLVRAATPDEGRRRIEDALAHYRLPLLERGARIVPVCGDLGLPRFGLSDEAFDRLARAVGTIYHAGAAVNHVRPYGALRGANVIGTTEIIRLAVHHGTRPIHYLSTIAVLSGRAHRNEPVLYEALLDGRHEGLPGSYAQTKWVAERLMTEAAARGVPVAIYRLGQVTGHHATGVTQTGDFVARFLQGCVQLGTTIRSDAAVDLIPVDHVARAIVALATHAPLVGGTVHHLVHPNPPAWSRIVRMLASEGYPLDERPFDSWYRGLVEAAGHAPPHALVAYLAMLEEASEAMTHIPRFDQGDTERALAAHAIHCPPIDATYVRRLIAFYVSAGTLPAPTATRPAHESRNTAAE